MTTIGAQSQSLARMINSSSASRRARIHIHSLDNLLRHLRQETAGEDTGTALAICPASTGCEPAPYQKVEETEPHASGARGEMPQREEPMTEGPIHFQEMEIPSTELLREIGAPGLKKNFKLPPQVAQELRRQQIHRLEENITLLRKKQEEFHHKMEDYIGSLRSLIKNLQQGTPALSVPDADSEAKENPGTYVRCVGCGTEHVFTNLDVLFADEPEDMFTKPIEVIVQQEGKLKKGTFRCPRCGDCNLSIRPR